MIYYLHSLVCHQKVNGAMIIELLFKFKINYYFNNINWILYVHENLKEEKIMDSMQF